MTHHLWQHRLTTMHFGFCPMLECFLTHIHNRSCTVRCRQSSWIYIAFIEIVLDTWNIKTNNHAKITIDTNNRNHSPDNTCFYCEAGSVSSSFELCGRGRGNTNSQSSSTLGTIYGCDTNLNQWMYPSAQANGCEAKFTPVIRLSAKCNHWSSITTTSPPSNKGEPEESSTRIHIGTTHNLTNDVVRSSQVGYISRTRMLSQTTYWDDDHHTKSISHHHR